MMNARKSGLALTLIAPLALVACSTETQEDVVVPDAAAVTNPDDPCGAALLQQHVGNVSPDIQLPPGTEFRHYRTGDPVSEDVVPTRLNFEYDRSGTLVAVTCG